MERLPLASPLPRNLSPGRIGDASAVLAIPDLAMGRVETNDVGRIVVVEMAETQLVQWELGSVEVRPAAPPIEGDLPFPRVTLEYVGEVVAVASVAILQSFLRGCLPQGVGNFDCSYSFG